MSLKAFHLFFIGASVVLAAFVAGWAVQQYQADGRVATLVTGVVGLSGAAGLAVYGARFRRKARGL